MKKYSIEIKWGIIFALMGLLWMVLERLAGLHDEHLDKHVIYTNFVAIPAIAIYVFGLLEKRKKDYEGSMSYWQGFKAGLIITLVVTLLTPLTQWLTLSVITPDYLTNAKNFAVESGNMQREEAEAYFTQGNYMVQSIVGAPIMGILTSAIVALFTRKSKN
ncbi:DUF4199 domain-containing protein [Cyclobacterium jeungdonense]|uniref:DUF4199 domain-containing protein n=1 Tax=Cyclobacterium jeungdonense TaxID=708087 RepID=A0ABT8C474_9BACT|nr:DUF4199 domain-containing protein [Cyclobacterium jeungdonense]MDN3687559.1 DUF4199 domain-containing protein [Cyclobacterium jeungdonense]